MAKEKKPVSQAATKATVKRQPKPAGKPLFDFSNLLSTDQEKLFKYAFIIVATLIFVVRPMFSSRFGPSGDEITHKNLGDLSYDYLSTFGKNDSVFRYTPNQREDATLLLNYGPLLEVTSAAIYKHTGTNPYQTRHLVLTLFTFLLFFYCGMAAYKIGGWRAGLMAMIFMLVSPRLFGESFNNPKDPPFAASYVMALYGLLCLVSELPKPSWKTIILTMIGIGLAFSIRVGGLLLFPYTIIFVGLAILLKDEWRERLLAFDFKYYQRLLIGIAVIFAGAWIIGICTWPAALRNPIGQPLHALAVQSSYPTVISILYDGKVIGSNEVPSTYNPFYITATSPVIVIIGLFIGLLLLPFLRKTFNLYYLFMVLFVSAFPLFWIIYKHSALLNGWRHSYFTYTGIAVFAAVVFEGLFRIVKPKAVNYVLAGVIAVGVLLPGIFIVKNFPVVYVYFNEFVGGVSGTYGDYNMDYYACSAKPAADWISKNLPYDSTRIMVSNNSGELYECLKMNKSEWHPDYIRYRERNERNWDYAVFLPQFVDPEMMKKGFFAPKGTIHKIMVDDCLVACIVKRESKDDEIGIEAIKRIMKRQQGEPVPGDNEELKNSDPQTALSHLDAAVRQDPNNEIALAYLGLAYAMSGDRKNAIASLSRSLSISPNYQMAQAYMQQISR
ncbi:MAG: phospholipid carrier-dependent glycosyltransferase [Bacteroidetes bacterium]|nr:phospholipid carrier-dependent glycosyltransferase [Bacteroidota bacterium]